MAELGEKLKVGKPQNIFMHVEKPLHFDLFTCWKNNADLKAVLESVEMAGPIHTE